MSKVFTDDMAQQLNNVIIGLVASFNKEYGNETGHVFIDDDLQSRRDSEVLSAVANIIGANDGKTFENECARLGRMGSHYGKMRKAEDERQ